MIQMHEVPPIVQLKDVFPAPRCMLMIMVKSSASDTQFLSFSTASGVQFNLTVAVVCVFFCWQWCLVALLGSFGSQGWVNISALASTLASFIYSNKILFSVKLTSPCGSSRDSDLPVRTSVGLRRFTVLGLSSAAVVCFPSRQYWEGVWLVCIKAPACFLLCWLPLRTVEWVGVSRTRSQPCTRRFPFHFVHINRMEKQGKRERGRERSTTKAKRRERRGGGESRAQSVGVCPRPMNEIFISDAKEARLLSHFISSHISSRICLSPALLLLFTLSSSFFLFLSDIYCNSLLLISPCISPRPFPVPPFSILSELSPLVEVGQRFLFISLAFPFLPFCPWRKQEITNQ